jgi:FAD:protein FMN transferase
LGTIVDIACEGADSATMSAAIDDAFREVAFIHELMSFQSATSELSIFNSTPTGQWCDLSHASCEVFAAALELWESSGGAFDVCLAGGGTSNRLELDTQLSRIRRRDHFTVDLSGIAKGYAVDRAVAALQRAGVPQGIVNAGGDLRLFGDKVSPIAVRCPSAIGKTVSLGAMKNCAVATSASYFTQSCVIKGQGQAVNAAQSWTISAPTCMMADGLTKVLAVTQNINHPIFKKYDAQGWLLT